MIGFIDSGVGGLNVMSECQKLFGEDYVFLCDNKHSPYGNKSYKRLYHITKNNIDYLIKHYNITACVLACNTLSYTIGKNLQSEYDIPIILTTMPKNKIKNLNSQILFFGTKNTVNKIKKKYKNIKTLFIKNLPKKIDNNLFCLNNLENILKKNLLNIKFENINKIILGCTHFKSIQYLIQKILPNIEIVDYNLDIAQKIKNIVENKSSSSFHIVLTDYNYPKYVELKSYYRKLIFDKNI